MTLIPACPQLRGAELRAEADSQWSEAQLSVSPDPVARPAVFSLGGLSIYMLTAESCLSGPARPGSVPVFLANTKIPFACWV